MQRRLEENRSRWKEIFEPELTKTKKRTSEIQIKRDNETTIQIKAKLVNRVDTNIKNQTQIQKFI